MRWFSRWIFVRNAVKCGEIIFYCLHRNRLISCKISTLSPHFLQKFTQKPLLGLSDQFTLCLQQFIISFFIFSILVFFRAKRCIFLRFILLFHKFWRWLPVHYHVNSWFESKLILMDLTHWTTIHLCKSQPVSRKVRNEHNQLSRVLRF